MQVDLMVRGGSIVDGTGAPAFTEDIAIDNGRIVAIGDLDHVTAPDEINARGCVVSPGFINVLSHAYYTLQEDPRGLSDLYQGVTTQVFGEGISLGPMCGAMTEEMMWLGDAPNSTRRSWPRLRDFLMDLESDGVGQNVASFVGAANLRMSVIGLADRKLTPDELRNACDLLESELTDGALGVGSALIYPPGSYADTAELTAYADVLARHDALYISHIRNEGDRLVEAVEELIGIARDSGARAEIYHLKTAGRDNWSKMIRVLEVVESARMEGLEISANIYPYTAGGTALAASVPAQFHLGGMEGLRSHLRTSEGRASIAKAIEEGGDWENLWSMSQGGQGVFVLSNHPELGISAGTSVAEIAAARGDSDPVMTMLDIVEAAPLADAAYFIGNEDNIRLAFARPWVSVCSDSDAPAADERFADQPAHPRAYGAFARVLGRYARDEGIVSLEEAVKRMTSLPASTLRLHDRGEIRVGAHADIAIFAPEEVLDLSTYDRPAVYARGMRHVLVNGVCALRDGQPTGSLAGKALTRDNDRLDSPG